MANRLWDVAMWIALSVVFFAPTMLVSPYVLSALLVGSAVVALAASRRDRRARRE